MSTPPIEPAQHKNDIYGDLESPEDVTPPILAATVALLRDTAAGPEVLMLHKTSKIAFGGMWVFPGGRIDPEDYRADSDLEDAARRAAAREAAEEAGVHIPPRDFVWFAHWTPPPSTRRRFATWFFATKTDSDHQVQVDGGEIQDHAWIAPSRALARHRAGDIDLAPPTWVTLYHLSRYKPADAVLDHLRGRDPGVYETHVAQRRDGVRVALWRGDAGYDDWNADARGARHRLIMAKHGFDFEHPLEAY